MPKFGFTSKDVEFWKDKPFTLKGDRDIGVILIHGWSSGPKQVLPIAKKLNEEGFWVHAPMLSGHGAVPEDLEKATHNDWIRDVESAVEYLRKVSGASKIVVGGVSLGGNLAILASKKVSIDGFIFMGMPVFLKNHFGVWLGIKALPFFKKYVRKKYPKNVADDVVAHNSYQYYPVVSADESMKLIRLSRKILRKVTSPSLVLQTSNDYLVSKTSPWIIYNVISSKEKKLQWVKTKHNRHVFNEKDIEDSISIMVNFLNNVEKNFS